MRGGVPPLPQYAFVVLCSVKAQGQLLPLPLHLKSRDSSVGIALGYGLDDRGSRVRFPAELGTFLFTTASRTALGPPSLLSSGYRGLFPRG
jgi:hypothetical protein